MKYIDTEFDITRTIYGQKTCVVFHTPTLAVIVQRRTLLYPQVRAHAAATPTTQSSCKMRKDEDSVLIQRNEEGRAL